MLLSVIAEVMNISVRQLVTKDCRGPCQVSVLGREGGNIKIRHFHASLLKQGCLADCVDFGDGNAEMWILERCNLRLTFYDFVGVTITIARLDEIVNLSVRKIVPLFEEAIVVAILASHASPSWHCFHVWVVYKERSLLYILLRRFLECRRSFARFRHQWYTIGTADLISLKYERLLFRLIIALRAHFDEHLVARRR